MYSRIFYAVDAELKIKPADKDSAVFTWSKYDYLLEAKNHINNSKVYQKWSGNPLQKVNTKIKSGLTDMLNCKEIDKKIMNYLLTKQLQLGRFYLLPKISKRTSKVPGRPVIANNGTATENISAFIDCHLKTIVPTVLHIREDTRDFLSRLNELCEIPENAYLEWFDVVGSYPHQPYEENLEILKCCLDKGEDQWVSSENLCGLVKMILKHIILNWCLICATNY